jgi:hypothetical protein
MLRLLSSHAELAGVAKTLVITLRKRGHFCAAAWSQRRKDLS